MKDKVVSPEQFEKALISALAEYGDEVTETVEQVAKGTARQTAKAMKQSAPTGGRYARGWTSREVKGPMIKEFAVYNRTDYQLIHLLESPHETGGGGHYPKNVDYTGTMERVEEEYVNKYIEEVMAKI